MNGDRKSAGFSQKGPLSHSPNRPIAFTAACVRISYTKNLPLSEWWARLIGGFFSGTPERVRERGWAAGVEIEQGSSWDLVKAAKVPGVAMNAKDLDSSEYALDPESHRGRSALHSHAGGSYLTSTRGLGRRRLEFVTSAPTPCVIRLVVRYSCTCHL
jgi:hypothetical protein